MESIGRLTSRSTTVKDLALLPAMIGAELLAELQTAGISSGSSDPANGSLGALSGLAAAPMSIWIEDDAQLEKARVILERILKSHNLDATAGNLQGHDEIKADQVHFDTLEGLPEDAGHHTDLLEGGSAAGDGD